MNCNICNTDNSIKSCDHHERYSAGNEGNVAKPQTLTFEIGDVAHCPYYNYTGLITDIKEADGFTYIILHDPYKPGGHKCHTRLSIRSVNAPYPQYLQLICKKKDFEDVANWIFFKDSYKKQPA